MKQILEAIQAKIDYNVHLTEREKALYKLYANDEQLQAFLKKETKWNS